jgi:hypothetical protein
VKRDKTMAQFRATIRGQRGEASRLGSKKSGITANVNGWGIGVHVEASHAGEFGDCIRIWATKGSSADKGMQYIGMVDANGVFHNV